MAKITPCTENGKTTVVPDVPGEICFGSTEFHTIRAAQGVQPKWIEQFLLQHETRRNAQRAMAGGVGQMRVPAEFLRNLTIPVAPRREQSRIAEALDELFSDLDAGVAALERARERLKLYRASVLKAAVEGSLTAEWRLRNPQAEPGAELLKRILRERRQRWEQDQIRKFQEKGKTAPKNWKAKYKEPVAPDTADLPPLPEGWCWAGLAPLAWSTGYGTSVKCRIDDHGLAVLRIPNVVSGRLSLIGLKFAPVDYTVREDDLLAVGDLLVVRTNGSLDLIGRGAVVREKPEHPLSFASYLIRLRLVGDPLLFRWISLLWDSLHVRQWIETHAATSAGQYNISLRVLDKLSVPIPPLIEQRAIVEAVEDQLSTIERLESDIESRLEASQALRQATLKHAFSGKLVPQDPKDEPASELLERIAAEREARESKAAAAKRPARAGGKTRRRRRSRTSPHQEHGPWN